MATTEVPPLRLIVHRRTIFVTRVHFFKNFRPHLYGCVDLPCSHKIGDGLFSHVVFQMGGAPFFQPLRLFGIQSNRFIQIGNRVRESIQLNQVSGPITSPGGIRWIQLNGRRVSRYGFVQSAICESDVMRGTSRRSNVCWSVTAGGISVGSSD